LSINNISTPSFGLSIEAIVLLFTVHDRPAQVREPFVKTILSQQNYFVLLSM
jgi:hypothetical protein